MGVGVGGYIYIYLKRFFLIAKIKKCDRDFEIFKSVPDR